MDNIQFGAFVAQLRKEKNLTQRELAQRIHVTDKAVSKWECGKGFPDLKLLQPLAGALDVSLVELLQGTRSPASTLTKEEAGQAAVRAMEQSQRTTARRYLKLLRWLLTGIGAGCLTALIPCLVAAAGIWQLSSRNYDIIGGADGPTAILTATAAVTPPLWLAIGLPLVILCLCTVLSVRVWKVERRLR